MTTVNQQLSTDLVGAGPPGSPIPWAGGPVEPPETNPLTTIHGIMKGRYILAVTLALVLGGTAGYFGYKSQKPIYRSTAMIRFRAMMPRILYSNEHNQMLPMFDSFVDSQTMLMRSQRVTDMAMQSDDWKALHRGFTPEDAAEFVRAIDISRPPGSEMVQIAFSDPDPNAAIIGARAVMESYQKIWGDSDFGADAQRMNILEQLRTRLTDEIKGYGDRIQLIATEFGTDELDEMHQYQLTQLNKIETELRDAQLMATKLGAVLPAPSTTVDPFSAPSATSQPVGAVPGVVAATQPHVYTEEEIASTEPRMAEALQHRRDEERKIQTMIDFQHMQPEHPLVRREQATLKFINEDIARMVAGYVPPAPRTTRVDATGEPLPAIETAADYKAKAIRLQQLFDDAKARSLDVGRKELQIKSLRDLQDATRAKLNDTTSRIDQLNLESTGTGRISVVSEGDRPGLPYRDLRKQFGLLGGLGGAFTGIGLVMLLGLLDRRLRSSNDASAGGLNGVEMLGVLPHLPVQQLNSESAVLAAHCVHGVRASLQVAAAGQRRVYAITSPAAGEGKTSLTLALGMSFAATGARTLLIDCDLIGGGMSSRVKGIAKTTLLTTLLMQKRLTRDELKAAVKHSQKEEIPLDQAIIDLDMLPREAIDAAIAAQNGHHFGLMDVIHGEPLMTSVQSIGEQRLSVLTLGGAEPEDVQRLSPKKLGRVIELARKNFDVVLVDTGPVLGSLEAVMIGSRVDAMLMVVSRGTNRSLAVRALERLQASGGRAMGVVFNRAASSDATYSSSSSHGSVTSRRSSSNVLPRRPLEGLEEYERMGPLAAAVAMSTRSNAGKPQAAESL